MQNSSRRLSNWYGEATGRPMHGEGLMAIQCRLRELMAEKGRRDGRRITYEAIRAATGVNMNTLTRLANDRADMVALSTIDRLCTYFGCSPGDLLVQKERPIC